MSDHETPADKSAATDVQSDHTGAETTTFGGTVAVGDVHAEPIHSRTVDLQVKAEYLDDESSWVHLIATVGGIDVKFALRPTEAARLSAKLQSAAAFVDRENGQ